MGSAAWCRCAWSSRWGRTTGRSCLGSSAWWTARGAIRAGCFHLSTPLELAVDRDAITAEFDALEGARQHFVLSWYLSYTEAPPVEDSDSALARNDAWWREWSGRCTYGGEYRDAVLTSLITLKAMTDETTGGLVAAPTTSLPEDPGGVRN
jgi:hypothetical protein